MKHKPYDIFIIGGGINGAGIARDAVGRGYSVYLAEKGDIASGASSLSTELVHARLGRLGNMKLSSVRQSLVERNILSTIAPHLMKSLSFVIPHTPTIHSFFWEGIEQKIYDLFVGKSRLFKKSKTLTDKKSLGLDPLSKKYGQAIQYSDAWINDSRIVLANMLDASENGATISPRTKVISAECVDGMWHITVQDVQTKNKTIIVSRTLINATGAWVDDIPIDVPNYTPPSFNRVKGSHIIVSKIYDGSHVYVLPTKDKNVVFTLPFEKDFTLIGTAEKTLDGKMPKKVKVNADEEAYLIRVVNNYFKKKTCTKDIVHRMASVQAFIDEHHDSNVQSVMYEYGAPLVTVVGGKITTYRTIAEKVIEAIQPHLGEHHPSWTADKPLPGGAIDSFDDYAMKQRVKYPFLPPSLVRRYARQYGERMDIILSGIKSVERMGKNFDNELYQVEVDYLRAWEWAITPEDILWRRTKLGLFASPKNIKALEKYMM